MNAQHVASLKDQLSDCLGPEAVISDPEECHFYSSDVYSAGQNAQLVIRPAERANLPLAVRLITAAGFSVVPRGGGMSYTGGYTPANDHSVIIDLSALNRILEINEEDLVITVEAGVTWEQIDNALKPLGLRLPFFGTFSGARATVGGGLSNGALFMGTARYGTAAEIVLGMEVIRADGALITTGQAGFKAGRPGFRNYGPDLTGLFSHDAGAMGIKTAASLRMIQRPAHEDYLSFAFKGRAEATKALSAIARSGAVEEVYLFDPATTARSLDPATLREDIKKLHAVVRHQDGLLKGLREGAKLVGAGRQFIGEGLFSLHLVCAGRSRAAVDEDLKTCASLAKEQGAMRIANTIPKAARSCPFEPLNGILGAEGERWAALNAKVPHSDAQRLMDSTEALLEPYAERMAEHRVTMSFLFIAISNHIFSYEPVLRWHDEWLPVHRRTPDPAHLERLQEPDSNPLARALVDEIRRAIVFHFADLGVASNQIGKTYRHRPNMDPAAGELLDALKQHLDPQDAINPGALLGMGSETE